MSDLYFTQCNLQRTRLAQMLLNGKIGKLNKTNTNFVFFIQEPCQGKTKAVLQPNSVQKFSCGREPRAVIYIDKNTPAWYLEDLSHRDLVVVQITIKGKPIILASSYLDYNNKDVTTPELEKLLNYSQTKGLIIGMDSNCHSTLYGPTNNARGDKLEIIIANHNLKVENIGMDPTYESRGAATCIDVTLTRNIHQSIMNWEVDRGYNASDHNTITYELKQDFMKIPKTWKWHKADWECFREEMCKFKLVLPDIIDQQFCEEMVSSYYKSIRQATKKAVPRGKARVIDKNNPWWSPKYKEMRWRVNKLYKTQLEKPTLGNINKYKEAHQEYKRTCEKARKEAWHDFQTTIDSNSEANVLRKIIEGSPQANLGALLKPDGTMTEPGEETIQQLVKCHVVGATDLKPTQYSNVKITKTELLNWDEDIVTSAKIKAAHNGFQNKKSPGTDSIQPLVLKQLPDETLDELVIIYKACLLLGFTPTAWKEGRLVFIPKPGKPSYKIDKAWRPITLTNYPLKALEKLCSWHMDDNIAKTPLHDRQHGFRSDRNTETSISNVCNYIEKHIYKNEYVLGVFLDIQAAFDTISPTKIKDELLKFGGNKNVVNWYYNYITHRNLHINIKGVKKIISAGTGFPQGGVCSAKFWIIVFNEAIEIINTLGIYGNGFADDCVALVGGTNLHHMMSRMQKVVTKLEIWGKKYGLTFNPAKTVVVVFTHKYKYERDLPNKLRVGNQPIDFSREAKYLGVTLDNKLMWNTQFENLINKNKRYTFMLKNSISKKWGPRPKYIKWIIMAVSRPRITYGAIAWGHILRYETKQTAINQLNKLACNIISNTRRSTPRAALEVMYDLPPLDLVVKKEALCCLARNKHILVQDWPGQYKEKTTSIGHLKYWDMQSKLIDIDLDDSDRTRQSMWSKKYTVNTDSFKQTHYPIQAQINIYTDGSKTDEHTGIGVSVYHFNNEIYTESIKIPDYCTVYQSEALAIKLVMQNSHAWLNPDMKYIKIFSDSQAVLKSLAGPTAKSKLIYETHSILNHVYHLHKLLRLELSWIKAHNNYIGNERADELARNATFSAITYWGILPPFSYLKKEICSAIYELWNNRWQTSESYRMTKIFYPTVHKGKAKKLLELSRDQSRRLIEIVTGQNNLHYIQNKVTKAENLCRLCEEEEETFDHFVFNCPCLYSYRMQYFRGKNFAGTHKWDIQELIDYSHIPCIDRALKHEDSDTDD